MDHMSRGTKDLSAKGGFYKALRLSLSVTRSSAQRIHKKISPKDLPGWPTGDCLWGGVDGRGGGGGGGGGGAIISPSCAPNICSCDADV
nr:unnamed protein product [Callosobruchus chinensis]